ncbi:hypothetical protein GCM10017774_55410 [Lentzea cavernae]|uniref:Uncharacterized protein n=1 Tax=Lentzea cavernae TaxID=2020703 RepID=A0ABQ3MN04_9PSEU|nr:hypothetical protein GCM10017774_55410 [Lentzea cavernae]
MPQDGGARGVRDGDGDTHLLVVMHLTGFAQGGEGRVRVGDERGISLVERHKAGR